MPALSHGEVKQINGKRVSSPEYRSWQMMRNRCLNPRALDWKYYGGRGIKITPRWNDFTKFLKDMGRKPGPAYTLERRNNNGHYTKANCVWATRRTQSRNRAYVKLSVRKVRAIRAAYATGGVRQVDLAEKYGVAQSHISHVILNHSWRQEVDQ